MKKYTAPKNGQALLSVISTACITPPLSVKFCNILKAYYYPNTKIPRYSVTCLLNPELNGDFIRSIQTIEENEKVASIIKPETEKRDGSFVTTGNILIKFQTKELIPVYVKEGDLWEPVELEDELSPGEKVVVHYDIFRYTNRITNSHGLNFKPTRVDFYPAE